MKLTGPIRLYVMGERHVGVAADFIDSGCHHLRYDPPGSYPHWVKVREGSPLEPVDKDDFAAWIDQYGLSDLFG